MYLVSLDITDFRATRRMTLDFASGEESGGTRRWTVLLGENGCGKSTILKAIGLLLAGSDALSDLLGEPDQWIRNGASKAVLHAVIQTTEGQQRDVSLTLQRGDGRTGVIRRNADTLQALDAAIAHADRNYFIAGYGAFRRPPAMNRSHGPSWRPGRSGQLASLFGTEQELFSLEQWATDLDYTDDTGKARAIIADALAKLLPGMRFKDIDKRHRSIIMKTQDGDVPLRQLSEGYQAMAAWAGDLLYCMSQTFRDRTDPLNARGVLLLDEMDLHLHPIWKRTLVDFLNAAFPNLQIVATTHSPLSIQQCGEGELFVVRRERNGPTLIPFAGDPSMLRLSELFLSPLIGLETLDSPKVASLRDEARSIELKSKDLSDSDLVRLAEIQDALGGATPLPAAEAPEFKPLIEAQQNAISGLSATDLRARAAELFGPTSKTRARARGDASSAARKQMANTGAIVPRAKPPAAGKKATAKKAIGKKTAETALRMQKGITKPVQPAKKRSATRAPGRAIGKK